MRSPLNYTGITQKFKKSGKDKHLGIDMGWNSKYGGYHAPVLSSDSGIVVNVEYQAKSGGYVIGIYHPQYNVTSEYGHLQKGSIRVKLGDTVGIGQHVANMGNSGLQNGEPLPYHLHYGICKGKGLKYGLFSSWLDPVEYLNLYDGQIEAKKTKAKLNHTKRVTAKDGLNIRNKASIKGKVVNVAKYNEQVECYKIKNGWELVDNFNKYYCSAKYLR